MSTFVLAKFLHIASVIAFVAFHAVSMVVLYRIRRERDRKKILDLVTLSGETTLPMYVSLLAIVLSGVFAAFRYSAWGRVWLWVAIVLLVLVVGLMTAVAKPYFERIKAACEVRPSGVPRVSDEELAQVVGGRTAHVIAGIGVGGLVAILYLMVAKPWT